MAAISSIKQGKVLTKDDLNIYLYNGGNLTDPFSLNYTILDCTGDTEDVIGLPNRIPIKFATGSFYAPWTIPDDEPNGLHKVVWRFKDTATGEEKVEKEEFQVVPKCVGDAYQYPDFIKYLIIQLRAKLRDINPDRDYSIAGDELITVRVYDKDITLSIEELYKIVMG